MFLLLYNFILKQKILYIFNISILKTKTLNKSPLKLNIQTTKCYKILKNFKTYIHPISPHKLNIKHETKNTKY